jgi:hypothetical protein
MKSYKRIKGTKIEKELAEIVEQHEKFKNSYFWNPPTNASGRRQYEKKYSREPVAFEYAGKKYEVIQSVSCSCKNIYYNFGVYVDGEKKTVKAIKSLI